MRHAIERWKVCLTFDTQHRNTYYVYRRCKKIVPPPLLRIRVINCFSAKIFAVNYASQAELKVWVAPYEHQADLKVFKVPYQHQANDNEGKWFFTAHAHQAQKKIFYVKYRHQADLIIFFVPYAHRAGWKDNAKKHLLY